MLRFLFHILKPVPMRYSTSKAHHVSSDRHKLGKAGVALPIFTNLIASSNDHLLFPSRIKIHAKIHQPFPKCTHL